MYKDKTIYADEKQEKTLTTPTKNDLKGADVMAYWGCDKRTEDIYSGNGIGADSMVCNDGKSMYGVIRQHNIVHSMPGSQATKVTLVDG